MIFTDVPFQALVQVLPAVETSVAPEAGPTATNPLPFHMSRFIVSLAAPLLQVQYLSEAAAFIAIRSSAHKTGRLRIRRLRLRWLRLRSATGILV